MVAGSNRTMKTGNKVLASLLAFRTHDLMYLKFLCCDGGTEGQNICQTQAEFKLSSKITSTATASTTLSISISCANIELFQMGSPSTALQKTQKGRI